MEYSPACIRPYMFFEMLPERLLIMLPGWEVLRDKQGFVVFGRWLIVLFRKN